MVREGSRASDSWTAPDVPAILQRRVVPAPLAFSFITGGNPGGFDAKASTDLSESRLARHAFKNVHPSGVNRSLQQAGQ